jgi:RNA polymerase primary sigma factor/RNA polymerase sigma factor
LEQERNVASVSSILECLSEREREIVEKRFGLTGRAPAQTLQEVGADLGVTKERIRQIEKRALAKLREAADAAKIEFAAA